MAGSYADFKKTDAFIATGGWTFGHLSYELLHPLYKLKSEKPDHIAFPKFHFFRPAVVIYIVDSTLTIEAENPQVVYNEIGAWGFEKVAAAAPHIPLQQRFTKQAYIQCVQQLQQHILRGDCYEINFCQEFFAHQASLDPVQVFQNLMALSPNPFSALYKINNTYLICASPERFLVKKGQKVTAQPIKGTAKRSPGVAEDATLQNALRSSAKDQAENVMIVDLMRNDLSKVCEPGTVQVDELFGLYSFPQVHQLISTISGTLRKETSFTEIMEALFPMGSMTGAPKQRVQELIEQYEPTARGIFSGSVGFISPDGNFDFNVVIRSIMYNEAAQYLSYQVGSGITFYSDAAQEWEECLLKASAIKKVLTG
ncbi:MAG TPA: anthranilate synthase component I family protein [Chitinophagaceae bacterium]|nr:anthranilate synthase component I family protein [Chitinophagaceae bacterium]